ncbi:MAG: VOC family protein [Gammaproteobacteria bacterium]|nr:VOC family protein [Gammaproteobacteria bacterium]MDE0258117.1 VOC family protein [Gammaproteobacteria bacterium]
MILRVQHIGMVVRDLEDACARFERVLGLKARDFRHDQGKGMQLDARILLGNECWLHLVQNWNPESRVNRFLQEKGEGLEHICLETDDIEADVAHLREIGVSVWEDRILDANDGYEAFVYPDRLPGLTIELIQSHDRSWYYPPEAVGEPVSDSMELFRLQHIGLCVHDLADACERFERFFGLVAQDYRNDQGKGKQLDARILFPNQCWLHLVQNWDPESRVNRFLNSRGEGLDHIALQTTDIDGDVAGLRERGIPFFQDTIFDANDGYEAFVYPDQLPGMTAELIQPHAHSWGFGE